MTSIDRYKNKPLVSVIMTTYNVEKYVSRAINSILNQTYKKIELIIIDDNSSDNTIDIIKNYNDPRIKLYKNTINAGTYFCKNFGITKSKGRFIAIQDSDDYSSPVRIERQLSYFETSEHAQIVKCQYVRVDNKGKILTEPKAAFQASLIKKEVFTKIGYYDTVRVAGDDEFDCRAKLYFGASKICILPELYYFNLQRKDSLTNVVKIGGIERTTYVNNYTHWHKNNKETIDNLFVSYPHVNRPFDIPEKIKVYDYSLKKDRFQKIKTKADFITASLASFPKREVFLKKVVNNILPQVDKLLVYLNNYENIPEFLLNKKIEVRLGVNNAGDIADNGKFYNIDDVNGFFFTIDDDINYPQNYVQTILEKLEYYNYVPVIGFHGVDILYDNFKSYYDINSRKVYSFNYGLKEDIQTHIIGTGTIGYHTNTLRLNYFEINKLFMVDIFFAIQAQRVGVPLICISRINKYITEYNVDEATKIYTTFRKKDDFQSELVLTYPFEKAPIYKDTNNLASLNNNYQCIDEIQSLNRRNINLISTVRKLKVSLEFQKKENINIADWYRKEIAKINKWHEANYKNLPKPIIKISRAIEKFKFNKKSDLDL